MEDRNLCAGIQAPPPQLLGVLRRLRAPARSFRGAAGSLSPPTGEAAMPDSHVASLPHDDAADYDGAYATTTSGYEWDELTAKERG